MPGNKSMHAAAFHLLLITVGLAAPWLVYPLLVTKLLCFAMFAMAFNLLIGQAGLLSFGHAMFFGGAAYLTGHALKVWALPVEMAIALGVIFAAACGAVVGLLAIRRHGIYFAMITLAVAQMFFYCCVNLPQTGGDDGISGIPRGRLLGLVDLRDDRVLYYLVFTIFVAAFLGVLRIIHSPFGQAMRAIRDNEARAVSLGYKVNRYKLITFTLSAALAGLAGALKVLALQLATLVDVGWAASGDVILMALVGGIGTQLGPLVGAGFMLAMQFVFQGYSQWVPLLQGLVFIAIVLLLPRGIVGAFEQRAGSRRAAPASDEEADPADPGDGAERIEPA